MHPFERESMFELVNCIVGKRCFCNLQEVLRWPTNSDLPG